MNSENIIRAIEEEIARLTCVREILEDHGDVSESKLARGRNRAHAIARLDRVRKLLTDLPSSDEIVARQEMVRSANLEAKLDEAEHKLHWPASQRRQLVWPHDKSGQKHKKKSRPEFSQAKKRFWARWHKAGSKIKMVNGKRKFLL